MGVNKRLTQHTGPCEEEQWGADPRFTHCRLCGKQRFYTNGWDGSHHARFGPAVLPGGPNKRQTAG